MKFQITIMLVLFAFVLVLIGMPSAFLMAKGLDRDTGMIGNMFTLLPPLPILFLGMFTSYPAVLNTVRAVSDKPVHYPLSIPFIR